MRSCNSYPDNGIVYEVDDDVHDDKDDVHDDKDDVHIRDNCAHAGPEDLLEYNVDPILDSANLDSAAIWKQPKLFLQSLYTAVWRFPSHRNAEMHLD